MSDEMPLGRLQVFIHDPLYKWAMTPQDAQQRQHGDPEGNLLDGTERDARPLNADAERALLRVKQKLKGLEGGVLPCYPFSSSMPPIVRMSSDTESFDKLTSL